MRASAAAALAAPHPVFTSALRRWSLVLAGSVTCCPRHVKDCVSNLVACVRVLLPVLWRSESQLHAWKRLQDLGTFFPNLLRALRWKRPLVVCWTLRSHGELAPPKTLEKKEGVPRWNQCWRLWARQTGALSAWFYSLAWSVFTGTLPILRGSDRDPASQTETCECEPCVMSRPPFVKRSGSFDQTSCLWSSRSLSLSSSFSSSSFFFSFLHFLETGKVKTPPPPNGHARILVNAEIYGRSLRDHTIRS